MTNKELLSKILNAFPEPSFANVSKTELESFDTYFDCRYRIVFVDDDLCLQFYATAKHTDYVFLIVSFSYSNHEFKFASLYDFDLYYRNEHSLIEHIVTTVINKENDNIAEELERKSVILFERLKVKSREAFVKSISDISEELNRKDQVSITAPVHIVPVIEDNKTIVSLYLKIGRAKKYYIVKNLYGFFSLIRNKGKLKYGKDLEIIHDLNIFDETSRKFINFLMTIVNPSKYDDRYLFIDKENILDEIFELYIGQYIMIDDNSYYVSLDERPISIHIDKDYTLHLVMSDSYRQIPFSLCLRDDNSLTIYKMMCKKGLVPVIDLLRTSPYPNIEGHIDEFKYSIILRYPEVFTFDDAIADEFIFEGLVIKVYFDLAKEEITFHDELYDEGGRPIKVSDLNPYNTAQYRRYRQLLTAYGFDLVDNTLSLPAMVWNFLTSDFTELRKVAEVYLSDNISNKVTSTFTPPQIRVNYENNLLDVFLEDSKYSDEDLINIYMAIKHKKKYIFLRNNIINIDNIDSSNFANQLEDYNLVKGKEVNKNTKLPLYYAFKTLDGIKGVELNEKVKDILSQIKNFKTIEAEIAGINGELRQYQVDGVKWLYTLYKNGLCGVLADDMGLGKTIEIITFLKMIKANKPVLIVSPKSLIFNWINEFQKFDDKTKVVPIYGLKNERYKIIDKIKEDKRVIYITSYDSLRQDEELYKDKHFDVMILDEAQAIKNSKTKKAMTVSHINSDVRFVLTGTPIENSILDLWSIFNFLMPGYLQNIETFKNLYETSNDYQLRIKKKITPFILRRNKKDVLKDLPPKHETIFSCEMNEEQRKVYDAHKLEAKHIISEGGKAFDVLYLLTRLRQICIDPSLFIENYHSGSGKIDALLEITEEKIAEGHRMLIFSQFVKALDEIAIELSNKDIPYLVITGKTPGSERVEITNIFNGNKKYKVVLISLKAGGTGLNLIGADTVIHLDPWWNIASQDQATDRAHRIGQERNVEVIKLICENSIEQRVVELQNKKKELIASLISEDESSITNLSLEDINFILN